MSKSPKSIISVGENMSESPEFSESQGSQETEESQLFNYIEISIIITLKYRFAGHKVVNILDMKDFVNVTNSVGKMEKLHKAKEKREEYNNYVKENGGDIHYYKVQYFSYRYLREVIVNNKNYNKNIINRIKMVI
jgi:hypothetical protein